MIPMKKKWKMVAVKNKINQFNINFYGIADGELE